MHAHYRRTTGEEWSNADMRPGLDGTARAPPFYYEFAFMSPSPWEEGEEEKSEEKRKRVE